MKLRLMPVILTTLIFNSCINDLDSAFPKPPDFQHRMSKPYTLLIMMIVFKEYNLGRYTYEPLLRSRSYFFV
jgi:hypothetical protein